MRIQEPVNGECRFDGEVDAARKRGGNVRGLYKWVIGHSNDPESYPRPRGSGFIVSADANGALGYCPK